MPDLTGAAILGLGAAVPDVVVTNGDLARAVDTSDEWIATRTGIRERRVAADDQFTSDLAVAAAQQALGDAGVLPDEIDLVICATITPDYLWPATACQIQSRLGARRAGAFDLSAACSGFVYGLAAARGFLATTGMRRVLVIGSDTLSKMVDWTDRGTCILFGDGAGAAVVGPADPGFGLMASAVRADGSALEMIWLPGGGTRFPNPASQPPCGGRLSMKGSELFKVAVKGMAEIAAEALAAAGLTAADVDLFVPHQANLRIISAAADRAGISMDRTVVNIDRYGNTSAASIPIALREAVQSGRLRRGDVVLTVGFGAGLAWGANVMRWQYDARGVQE